MKITTKSIPWIILLLVVIYFGWREYSHAKEVDKFVADLSKYDGVIEEITLSNGALVSSNNALAVNTQDQLKSIASQINDTVAQMIKKFKRLSNVTYVTNNFEAGNDSSDFAKEIPCDFKPFSAMYSDSTYSIYQTIHKNKFVIDTLVVPNRMALVFGQKKTGFMKRENYVDINNSNPLMVASNIKNYTFTPQKKWYDTRLANIGFGVLIKSAVDAGVRTLKTK